MTKSIEEFLDLSEEEIQKRMDELKRRIRTVPGMGFLEAQDSSFKAQPWPFLSYLAHYCPDLLNEALDRYQDYDGAENREAIMEGLRNHYITWKLISDMKGLKER